MTELAGAQLKSTRVIAFNAANQKTHMRSVNISLVPPTRYLKSQPGEPEFPTALQATPGANEFPVVMDQSAITQLLGGQDFATNFTPTNGTITDNGDTIFGRKVAKITNSASGAHYLSSTSFNTTTNQKYFLAVMAKYIGTQWIVVNFTDGVTNSFFGYFDLLNGLTGAQSHAGNGVNDGIAIYPLGSGWYLCTVWGHFSGTANGQAPEACRPVTGNNNPTTANGQTVLAAGPVACLFPLPKFTAGLPTLFIPGYTGPQ